MKPLIIVILLVMLTACATTPYQLRQAKRDFKQQNYRAAYVRLQGFARKGEPDAQYALGYLYYYGLGTTENPAAAKKWFSRAAQAGHRDAQAAINQLK